MCNITKSVATCALALWLGACSGPTNLHIPSLMPTSKRGDVAGAAVISTSTLLDERRSAETSEFYVPSITAIGFSSVSIQPSKNINQRRLMAMRAAKLDAYRGLTEQIHGIQIQGETTIGEAVLTSDKLASALRGLIVGARTVKIEPTSDDTYQVELAVSETHVDRLIKAYRQGLF